jgi:Cu(I)/Ag(I) efflux system membrane fusion protein
MELQPKKIKVAEFTCPMHPEVVSDKPGKCDKCGMALVERKGNDANMPLTVHRSAVIDTGGGKVVYVETQPGLFERRKIKTSHLAGDYYILIPPTKEGEQGLKEGDKVATAGNFLLDAQTNITSGASLLYSGATETKKEEVPKENK